MNKEKLKNTKESLEKIAEEQDYFMKYIINWAKDNSSVQKNFNRYTLRHENYIMLINEAYRSICEEFNFPYQEIKSKMDTD